MDCPPETARDFTEFAKRLAAVCGVVYVSGRIAVDPQAAIPWGDVDLELVTADDGDEALEPSAPPAAKPSFGPQLDWLRPYRRPRLVGR